jgi:enamine deaminase RidA (YjgF/YER057c/UK114 family)
MIAANPRKTLCEELGCPTFVDYMKVNSVVDDVRNITGGEGSHAVFVTP